MEINADSESLSHIFSGNNTIVVPDYQRNYAWQSAQIDAFVDDLLQAVKEGESHFFGPIVVLKPHNAIEGQLIDGQQRITTAIMFLCIIRDKLAKFENSTIQVNDVAVDIKSPIDGILLKTDMATPRFRANYQIRNIFREYIFIPATSDSRKTFRVKGGGMSSNEKNITKELRAAYMRLQKRLDSWLNETPDDFEAQKVKLHGLIQCLANNMELLSMRVYSEDDAYILFETLNDRGLRLTPSDLLKSYTLKGVEELDPNVFQAALTKWDSAVENLGSYPFTKFLRHYLLSIQGEKVQSKKIFKLFGDLIKSYGNGGALKNLDKVSSASLTYAQLLNQHHVTGFKPLDRCLKRLNLISETHRVFLLRVFEMNHSKEMKLRAASALEILAFRWILIGENAQEIETFYQTQAGLLTEDKNQEQLENCIKNILAKVPNDALVKSELLNNAAKRDLQFYVLKKLNYGLTKVEVIWDQTDLHIEHLAPQKPEANSNWYSKIGPKTTDDPDQDTYDDIIQKWGNLSLLEFEINTSVQNSEWAVKLEGLPNKPGLKKSNTDLTKQVALLKEWNIDLLNSRTIWVANAMLQITSPNAFDKDFVSIDPFCE
jgi:uncharacterized protein with ParB-like and HNH nuclease domain